MIEPFETNENLNSSYISTSRKARKNFYWKLTITLTPIILILIIIGIIIIVLSILDFNNNYKIEIICHYKVEEKNQEINILSEEYEKASNISIYIDDKIIEYNISFFLNNYLLII